MKKLHVFITGGAGFIGSFLVSRLVKEGYQVTIFDRYSPEKKKNLAHHADAQVRIIWGDVSRKEQVKSSYFRTVDWVFHLAGKPNVAPSLTDPLAFHRVHVDGTANVLEAARSSQVKRFVYAGSASCYGNADSVPTPETAVMRIDHPYALTKYIGEQYVLHWGRVYQLPVVSLRLFNSYGPRLRSARTYGPVFSAFLAQKLAGLPYTVVGDGTQKRDFVFVTDVVDAFFRAAQSSITNEVFNVGSGEPHSINELVDMLGGPVTYIPKRPGEPAVTHADSTKIRTALGWKPKVSFQEGVQRVVENIAYWKDAPVWTPQRIQEETRVWYEYLGGRGEST